MPDHGLVEIVPPIIMACALQPAQEPMQVATLEQHAPPPSAPWRGPRFFTPENVREERALTPWVRSNLGTLRAALLDAGALVLRGFALEDPDVFRAVALAVGGPLGEGYAGPSMRTELGQGVYTASEVPAPYVIPEHAELSYLEKMPRHLFFWCREPAPSGGQTTLVDGRDVLARLDRARVAPLLQGDLHIQRRHAPLRFRLDPFEQKPWPAALGTRARDEAHARARALGFTADFALTGALRLAHSQPAVRRHPITGESAWLNHLLVFHASAPGALLTGAMQHQPRRRIALSVPLARAYRRLLPALGLELASDVRTAQGTPIADQVVQHVRDVVDRSTYAHAWQRGDLLIVDNHLVLHGRRPYRGHRSVALSWSSAVA